MPVFDIQTKITGTASAQVVAETVDHARDMFNSGDAVMEIDDWDVCTDGSRGGFLDVSASTCVAADDPYETNKS
jgi:hypothetical protein